MPNPDPSLTPEAAAHEYARLQPRPWAVAGELAKQGEYDAYLAGHAHATAALSARLKDVERERDLAKVRGDNHWETLRSIRQMAQTEGDLKRENVPLNVQSIDTALSTPPSLALLEFAEKVWKEGRTSVFSEEHRTQESLKELWLASETYARLTRATEEAKRN